eukprot:9382022-Pyramimonas_sp.AAC.1
MERPPSCRVTEQQTDRFRRGDIGFERWFVPASAAARKRSRWAWQPGRQQQRTRRRNANFAFALG